MLNNFTILGAGIAGLAAGYNLKNHSIESTIYEKDDDWGGLCSNFTIGGFRFDRFVHLSFADSPDLASLFAGKTGMIEHIPFPSNYYHGKWLRHPAQNNLAPLDVDEKVSILSDFINRPQLPISDIHDYDTWLRVQYGNYFAEHFPTQYTKKYWGVLPKELETKWVGVRMYQPDLEQVLKGAFETQDECFYFAKKMYYPKLGGFKSILSEIREGLDIKVSHEVINIDTYNRIITFSSGKKIKFNHLISSIPLPVIVKLISDVPNKIRQAADELHYTCGYQVSIGLNKPDIPKHLWFYIYDRDILPSRVYSPSLKSRDNVPLGCSSLQAEIFFDCKETIPNKDYVLTETIHNLIAMNVLKEEDIAVTDIRFEPFANVTFVPSIYDNRKLVLDFLKSRNITSIGRFGKWDYLWTHQAFVDAITSTDSLLKSVMSL